MAKKKMKAQVRYQEMDGAEGYAINVTSGGDWELDKWFPLVKKEGGPDCGDYLHYTFLFKLAELQEQGYDIDLICCEHKLILVYSGPDQKADRLRCIMKRPKCLKEE